MRSPAAAMSTSLAADQMPPVWLVVLGTSRYAFYSTDITFDSNVYTATSGAVSQIEQTVEGKAPAVTLTMQNIDRVIRDWLDTSDRRGTAVTIRVVMADNLADGDALIEDTFDIDAYAVDNAEAQIKLGSTPYIHGLQIPRRRAQGFFCPWTYKGTECAYEGAIKTCDFTYDGQNGCTKHFAKDEVRRFGGYLGRPQSDLVVS